MKRLLPLLVVFLLAVSLHAADAPVKNLCANPSMEGAAKDDHLPQHWEVFTLGTPATFSTDTAEHHGGGQSVKLEAGETTRSYVWSDLVAVAPGEKVRASCYVKVADFKPNANGAGAVIVIAQFTQPDGTQEEVAKVGTADVKKSGWQLVEGTVTVPALARAVRLQIGFSWSGGTIYLDDATIVPAEPLVARIDLPTARVAPAAGGLPVLIINRTGEKGSAKLSAKLTYPAAQKNGSPTVLTHSLSVPLNGQPEQAFTLPFDLSRRGKATAEVSVLRPGSSEPAYTEERAVQVPPPLVLSPPIPTHWCTEDGAPDVMIDADVALTPSQAKGATLTVKVLDPTDTPKLTVTVKDPKEGWNHVRIQPKGAWPEMTYRIVAELRSADGTVSNRQPFTVMPRKRAEVTLSADGYPVYDGKKIFPLGIFNGSKFEEQGKAGFTVAHGYNAFNIDKNEVERPRDQGALDFMNNAHANGEMVCLLVPRGLMQLGDWEGFRRRVRMFKNHPALLCWDEEEEVARGNVKPEALLTVEKIIREEDPHHPFMVGDAKDVISRIAKDRSDIFPYEHMDMGMWWWYPFPIRPTKGDALTGEELTRGSELTPPAFLTKDAAHGKPMWAGVQFYKHENQKDARFPTPTEYRAQAYLAVIAGAKGLMYYGGSVQNGGFSWDAKNKRWNMEEAHWDYVKKLARELIELSPVFMSPTGPAPEVSPGSAPVSVMLKQSPERTLILAVNRDSKPVDVTITSPVIRGGSVAVLTEDRNVSAGDSAIKDRFEAYATHVYELKR